MKTIFNFKFSIFNTRGFTLMELLVSMALFAVISSIIVSVLYISFRTTKKSESLITLKQNGDAAMSQMVSSIRYAKSLDDPADCVTTTEQSSITITSASDGRQTIFSCPDDTSTTIASNGAALIDTNNTIITGCSFTCTQEGIFDPPTVTIRYSLHGHDGTMTNDSRSGMSFQTAVTLRNLFR